MRTIPRNPLTAKQYPRFVKKNYFHNTEESILIFIFSRTNGYSNKYSFRKQGNKIENFDTLSQRIIVFRFGNDCYMDWVFAIVFRPLTASNHLPSFTRCHCRVLDVVTSRSADAV